MKIKVIVTLKNGVLDPQGKAIQQTLNGMNFSNVSVSFIEGLSYLSEDSDFEKTFIIPLLFSRRKLIPKKR